MADSSLSRRALARRCALALAPAARGSSLDYLRRLLAPRPELRRRLLGHARFASKPERGILRSSPVLRLSDTSRLTHLVGWVTLSTNHATFDRQQLTTSVSRRERLEAYLLISNGLSRTPRLADDLH